MKSSKTSIRVMFSLSFFVLIVSSVFSYLSLSALNNSGAQVRHTYEVINKLDSVVSTMKDAETGYRGYLLTGNEVFLEPYRGSQNRVVDALNQAEILTM